MPLRLLPPPRRAAAPLLTPTVSHLACLLLGQGPDTPPLLLALLPVCPALLTPLLSRLLLSHTPPLPALSLYRRLLALRHFNVPESSLPVLLRLLARSRRHAHLSFPLLESLPYTHPHLLSTPALAALLSTALSASAPGASFDAAVTCFESAARVWARAGRAFGAAELNVLLRAFCARGRVAEARALFHRYCDAYPPDTRTFNTLLLGFKEAGHVHALDLFYHDAVLRGFVADAVSYCIRMDAYCKKGRFLDALELLDEMRSKGDYKPTLQVFTTLIYGAGIVRNAARARALFDEMEKWGVTPDRGAHNALMGVYVRVRDLQSAMAVMSDMERKGIGLDDVSYNTMLCGFQRVGDLEGIWKVYSKMVSSGFMPRTRTTMLLMKVFCENGRPDLGLELWDYLMGRGCVPHQHALDILVTGLCCRGVVAEAYRCFREIIETGMAPTERAFTVLEGFLRRKREHGKVEEIRQMMKAAQLQGHQIEEEAT
ncbi:Pentatricopeptide repeat-containing protein [Zea mays]|uniref:Pentatricopeptide repeat-containing protein n=2 Tax=Zea mays TaxID=4577 RepID=A0A1D6GUF5_MAIZE|nr:Pentatricopeptide repeat-containing protein [Zea mays]|eukprot:XP_008644996.2 pentatricopeptide repeat-containing protein At3g61360 [Zea mays]